MVNTPIPHSLKSEAKKAAKILRGFTIPNAKTGPDKLIPAGLILKAEGLAILTVFKAGFLVTARGGSGIVIAKLPNGKWSPPSAIALAGLGGGFEIGAEVTDFVIILNKRSAVDAFSKGGNLTLGGNFTIAAGPLGRNLEGDVSVRSPAAIYTYSKTKGLFAGISVEGSGLVERKDANKKFYHEDVRAFEILRGDVPRPTDCSELYDVLEKHKEMFAKAAMRYAKDYAKKEVTKAAAGKGMTSKIKSFSIKNPLSKSPSKSRKSSSASRRSQSPSNSYASDSSDDDSYSAADKYGGHGYFEEPINLPSSRPSYIQQAYKAEASKPSWRSQSVKVTKTTVRKTVVTKRADTSNAPDWDAPLKAKALWDFSAIKPCDLTFKKGEEVVVLTRTDTQDDWWEGTIHGKTGIFPANYVQVL